MDPNEDVDTTGSTTEDITDSEEELATPRKEYPKGYNLQGAIQRTTERAVPSVSIPINITPTAEQFWLEDKKPNVKFIKSHLAGEGRFAKEQVLQLIDCVYETFLEEKNVLHIPAPITICGDIHGQFFDLLKLFECGGDPENNAYLFLGDYVDRGDFSIEVLVLLLSYKCLYPTSFYMIRGNHECRHLTAHFSFKKECEFKYDLEVYDACMDLFDALPLAAIVNKQFFCVHGGLSPSLSPVNPIADIDAIDRFIEPPSNGLMCDLLWSDPVESYSANDGVRFEHNVNRGASWVYGYETVVELLDHNKWLSVIRAHESQLAGYRMYEKNTRTGFPSVITLFSAPNYCTQYNNKAAIMRYENNAMTIKQFTDTVPPYYLPDFVNVFEWSLPFVAEKVGEVVLAFLNLVNDAAEDEKEELLKTQQLALEERRAEVRRKIVAVGKVLALYKKMREDRQKTLELTGLTAKSHIPRVDSKALMEMKKKVKDGEEQFMLVKSIDSENEARPKDSIAAVRPGSSDGVSASKRLASRERFFAKRAQIIPQKQNPVIMVTQAATEQTPLPTITEAGNFPK